ncbi:hypothetical protein BABINDRAFT_10379 [Babjeviella inositovora NRRL Y-12698]|uniref:Probable NADPH dehydrogenase n=1 Tax=Babjeviella inositovora NRRL Y-12698 TaxID=984486 RepID=A0A1E3QHP4_9ASCO|nr:uncharacterized protein BABINDRAFT_10379 [Babjeviella inositovora NRRL Y-12698]ODQ77233.1 hypothetical protein BABINDRAFT_10379 [Babjeviella inositovora NRRL Y-12698]
MSDLANTNLFEPLQVGRYTVQHRAVLAPLTRFRNDSIQGPTEHSVEYYAQRASKPGTLLVTEATFVSPRAGGYDAAPGIWSPEQAAQWKKVFDAVHAKKSFAFVQLWALGRASKPKALKARNLPFVSASAKYIDAKDQAKAETSGNPIRALSTAEVKQYVKDYARAAVSAVTAGADGVEIHGANGYLPDQFTQLISNERTDEYGGSVENRARFLLEIVDAVTAAVGDDRTGIRFSPWGEFGGMGGAKYNPEETFGYIFSQLEKSHPKLAYIHLIEPRTGDLHGSEQTLPGDNAFACKIWSGPIIRAGDYHNHFDAIKRDVADGRTLIAFGRSFISNPDLPERLQRGWELTKYDRRTFYSDSPVGYTDYPFYHKEKL